MKKKFKEENWWSRKNYIHISNKGISPYIVNIEELKSIGEAPVTVRATHLVPDSVTVWGAKRRRRSPYPETE